MPWRPVTGPKAGSAPFLAPGSDLRRFARSRVTTVTTGAGGPNQHTREAVRQMPEANLRVVTIEETMFVALDDVAALLLDTAATVDDHEIAASAVLRSLAAGMAGVSC